MEPKKKRNLIIGNMLVVISIVLIWYIMREKVYCGTVTNKINGIEYNKHSTSPDPILIVRFNVNKKKKEIHVSWITYTESEVNEEVCFSQKISDMEPIWIESGLILLISAVFIATGLMFLLSAAGAFNPSTDGPY